MERPPGSSGFSYKNKLAMDSFLSTFDDAPPPSYALSQAEAVRDRMLASQSGINNAAESAQSSLFNKAQLGKGISDLGQQTPSPVSLSAVVPSVASTAAKGASLASRGMGLAPFAAANLIGSGISGISGYFQNKERIASQERMQQKDFDAASAAGLYHPSQFQGNGGALGLYRGGQIQKGLRTPRTSLII